MNDAATSDTKKQPKATKTDELFDALESIQLPKDGDPELVAEMRQLAKGNAPGWAFVVEGYLQGLTAAGVLKRKADGPGDDQLLRDKLTDAAKQAPRFGEVYLAIGLVFVSSVLAVSVRAATFDPVLRVIDLTLAVAVALWWYLTRLSWSQDVIWKATGRQRFYGALFVACFVPMILFVATWLPGFVLQAQSIGRYNASRTSSLVDPDVFPQLHRFALDNYSVEILYQPAPASLWTNTVELPDVDIASMSVQAGYCSLVMDRESVEHQFMPDDPVDKGLWVKGILMHEFGHCLDMRRDRPALGQTEIGTHALAPGLVLKDNDMASYMQQALRPESELWREAYADIFAIGYWRLIAPQQAHQLAQSLRTMRSDKASDQTHATMCWIDHAIQAASPGSAKDLMNWADGLRLHAPCSIASHAPPPMAKRIRAWLGI